MSRSRIYLDGKPAWTDNVPARARVAGYGGSALGHVITRTPYKHREGDQHPGRTRERAIRRDAAERAGKP